MVDCCLKALKNDVLWNAAEEEVDCAEGGKVHCVELFRPTAEPPQLLVVLGQGGQGGESLLQVRVQLSTLLPRPRPALSPASLQSSLGPVQGTAGDPIVQ